MTGQDGGFRAAAARFSADVEAALTRARRAAREARAQAAEFRKANGELAGQAKTGRLRGVNRDEVTPTEPEGRESAAKFRHANELPVEELPEAGALIDRLPEPEPEPEPDDDDFSQHALMVDIDDRGESADDARPAERSPDRADDHIDDRIDVVPDEGEPAGIDSPVPQATRAEPDDEDFSQQRILLDVTDETYRPNPFPDAVLGLPDEQNRS